MTDLGAQQRSDIRKECENLRKLLYSARPVGVLAILRDVGAVECDERVAGVDELPGVREKLRRLKERLEKQGIINVQG